MSSRIPSFDQLPDSAYIRQAQLVQSHQRPEAAAPLPFSSPTLWRKVKNGAFPKPIKLGPRITAWKVGDIRAWLAQQVTTSQSISVEQSELATEHLLIHQCKRSATK